MEWHKENINGKPMWHCKTEYWDFLIEHVDDNNSILWNNNRSIKTIIKTGDVRNLFHCAFDLELMYQRNVLRK